MPARGSIDGEDDRQAVAAEDQAEAEVASGDDEGADGTGKGGGGVEEPVPEVPTTVDFDAKRALVTVAFP